MFVLKNYTSYIVLLCTYKKINPIDTMQSFFL